MRIFHSTDFMLIINTENDLGSKILPRPVMFLLIGMILVLINFTIMEERRRSQLSFTRRALHFMDIAHSDNDGDNLPTLSFTTSGTDSEEDDVDSLQ
ncbi:hypothetical protein SNEBB_004763 [Seison nebaliae]|nr:hypothetical protein SNEBB_004763 [Seison nebaliae]